MKKIKQIEREIKRLDKISASGSIKDPKCSEAYEASHALLWVVEDVDWTPSGLIERAHKERP